MQRRFIGSGALGAHMFGSPLNLDSETLVVTDLAYMCKSHAVVLKAVFYKAIDNKTTIVIIAVLPIQSIF